MISGNKVNKRDKTIAVNGAIAILFLLLAVFMKRGDKMEPVDREAIEAARIMREAMHFVADQRKAAGATFDNTTDPYGTMLIGPEISEIMTTTGNLEAKRTTLHPSFASLIVMLMKQAGVSAGDHIALGCSGSFPGLLIAALSAAEAMNLETTTILTLGSSSYGATDPHFTIMDLHVLLYRGGFARTMPAAVSAGGNRDTGTDIDTQTLNRLTAIAEKYGITFISESDLSRNREVRDSIYRQAMNGTPSLFINSGGSYANMGSSNTILSLSPGLVTSVYMPEEQSRGVIHDMLAQEIPVIHLLNIRGLSLRYGIPWDSAPESGHDTPLLIRKATKAEAAMAIAGIVWFISLLLYLRRMDPFRH